MYKIINNSDLPFDEPCLSLIDVHSKGGADKSSMFKKAAMMTETLKNIKPEPGYSFLHLIAMGASDYYGANRNGDYFNETSRTHTAIAPITSDVRDITLDGGLKKYYSTFKTDANVYREHANKDVTKRRGTVLDNAYNDVMHRVELAVKVDNNICHDALEQISRNEQVFYSMAARVPHDICSICHNKAKTQNEYCSHIRNQLNRVLNTGHKVTMINDAPTFFDISFVLVPADRIAGTLRKIANFGGKQPTITAKLPVFMKSANQITAQKAATLKKLADIEKEIESNIPGVIGHKFTGIEKDIPDDFIQLLRGHSTADALSCLNEKKIMLSLPEYFKLVLGNKFNEVSADVPSALASLPTLFRDMEEEGDLDTILGDDEFNEVIAPSCGHTTGIRIPDDIISNFSLNPEAVKHRTIVITIRGGLGKRSSWTKGNIITKRGAYLAHEYGKYAIAFGSNASTFDKKMIIMRNRL